MGAGKVAPMSKSKRRGGHSYQVGYKHPPKETRFKPGESGNPNGRPKGPRSVGTILQRISRQRVTVNEGDKTRRLEALEVMLRRLANDAMRSDQKAIKLFLSLLERYAQAPEVASQLESLLAEDEQILARYLDDKEGAPTKSKSMKTSKGKRKDKTRGEK